jgi:hypothetical protein
MHAQADVPLTPDDRLAGVEPHSHGHIDPIGPSVCRESPLCGDRACDSVRRTTKGDEERVALRVHLPAPELREHFAEQAVVLFEDVRITGTESLEQARRSFDVCEEERDRPSR